MCESIGEHSKQNNIFDGLKGNKCIVGFFFQKQNWICLLHYKMIIFEITL